MAVLPFAVFPLFAIVLLFAPAAAEAEQNGIELDLSRPYRVGQVFSYAAVGRTYRETVVSTGGAVVNQTVTGVRCELAAALAVDAVREDGRPRELSVRVFRLVVREGFLPAEQGGAVDAGEQPLEKETEIRVTYPERGAGPPELARVDGEAMDESLLAALSLVLPGPAGTRDNDALFGKAGAARVGEQWDIATSEVAAALAEGGIDVPEDRLTGEVGLVTRDPETGTHVVDVTLSGERAGVLLPKGYVTRAGNLKVRLESTLPDDPAGTPLRETAEYSLQSQAMGREGEKLMVVDLAFSDSRTAHFREVAPTVLGAGGAGE